MRIVETRNATFIENGEISESTISRDVKIKKVRVQVPLTCVFSSKVIAPSVVVSNKNEEEQHNNETLIHNEFIVEEP